MQVTAFQLQKEKEKDRAVREAAKKAAPADRVVTEESYGALVDVRPALKLPQPLSELREEMRKWFIGCCVRICAKTCS